MISTLHKGNKLLPDPERVFIAEDDALNLQETLKFLDQLESVGAVEKELLEKCFHSINSRYTLKYVPNELLATRAFNIFHELLITKVGNEENYNYVICQLISC